MGAKRSGERMARLRDRLFAGMAARQVSTDVAEQVYTALAAFANFGFPESHSVAFAHLVYSTAWCKVHYPAAFTAGLLNAQPMGFWSPQSLVADAKRHGVVGPASRRERRWGRGRPRGGRTGRGMATDRAPRRPARARPRCGASATETATRIAEGQPWSSMEDLVRRAGVTRTQLEALATAGALDGLPPPAPAAGRRPAGPDRARRWCGGAGAASQATPDRLPGVVTGSDPPALPLPTPWEEVADDLWSLGMAPDTTAMELARDGLDRRGVLPTGALAVETGGRPDHRRRGGDPPPAARERPRGGLLEPRGRDRHGQHRLLPRRLDPVEAGGPDLSGPAGPGPHRASEGSMTLVAERFDPLELGAVPVLAGLSVISC